MRPLGKTFRMEDSFVAKEQFNFHQMFPWLHLFRAFRIAIDLRKLMLAGLGLMLISLGNSGFAHLPFAPK